MEAFFSFFSTFSDGLELSNNIQQERDRKTETERVSKKNESFVIEKGQDNNIFNAISKSLA